MASRRGDRRTTADALERHARDHECVKLRRAGVGWEVIAEQLGYASPGHAYDRFMVFMKDYPREDAETAREVEADRLDQLQRAIWAKCLKGDTWAIDRALRISDQRCRLLGLNMPVRQQIEVITESAVDAAIRTLTEQLDNDDAEVAGADSPAGRGSAGEAASTS